MSNLMLPDFRVRQRDFLLEISRAMTAQLDLGEVLRLVLNASVVMLTGQVGLVALREANGTYRIRATMGIEGDRIPRLNEQLHELVSTASEGTNTETFNEKLREMAVSLDAHLRQSIAMPLSIANEPLGVLIVFRSYRGEATPNDILILQSFADQAAIAVHNAQLYERIDQERKRLAAILQNSADGVMILGADMRILRFNRALERMTGWSAEDAVGRDQDEVIVWRRLEGGDLREALEYGWPFRSASSNGANADETPAPDTLYVEGDLQRRDGLRLSIAITYAPMMTVGGQLANIIANVRDITHYRQAQEMQNTFISVISHELKTPVALIKGYAGTLRREDAAWDPGVIKDGLAVIEDEADRLTSLIENLLTASKLQAQRTLTMEWGEVQLDSLAAESVERFNTQTKQHEFRLNFPTPLPVIQGDEMRLRQVLDNLMSNAIKYSPQGGLIEVGGRADSRSVTVYVRDSGVGMSAEELEHVFERFYRVDSKLSRKTQGAGLGLYLSKAIVEAHNGALRVESKVGQGTTFYLTLPVQ
ncbi:MAG: PAS domain S-box protein [Burkholderiales bacterium]|nr:PAS domain S-box protein [Anaerolineae bacterium]